MRYYYTDPLAAAWMAKHFGMKVTRTHCHREDGTFGESIQPVPIWILARDVETQVSENVKYYIHPDSLHLLGPRVGDTIEAHYELRTGLIINIIQGHIDISSGFGHIGVDPKKLRRIIQRNGITFHWPEVEA